MPGFDLPPYQQGLPGGIQPPAEVHPEVSQKCDAFMKEKIKEIAGAKLSTDERAAVVDLVKKNVVHIEHGSTSEVEKRLQALDQQVKIYLRTPQGEIPRSSLTATPELQEFVKKRTHEKQLDAKAEKLTGNYANILLGSINKLSLRPETKLFASKIVQDHVVALRHRYRQGEISAAEFEAGIKALPTLLRPLAERMSKLEKLEKKVDDVLGDITAGSRIRHMLESRIANNIQVAKEKTFPTLESIDELHKVVEKELVSAENVESYLANRYPDFSVYELPILDFIDTSGLEQAHIDMLHDYYDTCMGIVIDQLVDGKDNDVAIGAYLSAVELKISDYISKHTST